MDIQRLQKLAALAGLSLEGADLPRLLREINALEGLAATLPELREQGSPGPDAPGIRPEPGSAPLDRELLLECAPAMEAGFFVIPGVPHRGAKNE